MLTPLTTDLYQLAMTRAMFENGMADKKATFELFVRRMPRHRNYLVFAGLQKALSYLHVGQSFTESEVEFVQSLPGFRNAEKFLDHLRSHEFSGEVWAMREGQIFFANEPVIRITGTLLECQLAETALLSIINPAVMVASKASRIRDEAGDKVKLYEFGSRRTGLEEAVESARAAFIGGFDATSNVEAARLYGIPCVGTMAHSWVSAHESEQEAFERFLDVFPYSPILVDTYDPFKGTERAITAAKRKGVQLAGIRLDSGDLVKLSNWARHELDKAGFTEAKITVSGDLDEYKIHEIRTARNSAGLLPEAKIDAYGIGSNLVRSVDSPNVGAVYKLVELDGRPIAKFSEDKSTLPGAKQVWRTPSVDMLTLADEAVTVPTAKPLLEKVMQHGHELSKNRTLHHAKTLRDTDRKTLDPAFEKPAISVGIEKALASVRRG